MEWVAIALSALVSLSAFAVTYGKLQESVSAIKAELARLEASKASRERLDDMSDRLNDIDKQIRDAAESLHRIEGMLKAGSR